MTITANKAALAICYLSEWSVTNLQLQKILYIANMLYIGNNNEKLIYEEFEATDMGVILPNLYESLNHYGNRVIRTGFFGVTLPDEDSKEFKELEETCKSLLGFTGGQLVAVTHMKGGGWNKNWVAGESSPIPYTDIQQHYNIPSAVPQSNPIEFSRD